MTAKYKLYLNFDMNKKIQKFEYSLNLGNRNLILLTIKS